MKLVSISEVLPIFMRSIIFNLQFSIFNIISYFCSLKVCEMKEKTTEYEIMAPVGSRESLVAAIQAGPILCISVSVS